MKWKNYGLWLSIASILYMVLSDMGLQIDFTRWQTYVTAILGILATLGVISNPDQGRGFSNIKIPRRRKGQTSDQQELPTPIEQEDNTQVPAKTTTKTNAPEIRNEQTDYEEEYANVTPEQTPNTGNLQQTNYPDRKNIGERLPFEK